MKNRVMAVKPVAIHLKKQCPVDALIAEFNIPLIARQLKTGPEWHSKKRNSATVFKSDDLHVLLMAMHAVTRMVGHKVDVPLTIHVLEGRIKVITNKDVMALEKGALLVLEAGIAHEIEAVKESVFLLTLALGNRARVSAGSKEKGTPEVWGG